MNYQTGNKGNMSRISNNSTNDEGLPFTSVIPLDTIPALVLMVFILLINGGVILLISCYSYLRTTSNIILTSLAVSDFLVGSVGIPLLVASNSLPFASASSILLSCTIFFTFISLSSVLHITVMTCDRYIYIMCALRYREIVNRGRVLVVLGLTWFISLSALVRLSWTINFNIETASEYLALQIEKETAYFLFNFIVFFITPLIVMIVLDAHMLLLLRQQCQRIARENLPAEFMKREKKMQRRQRRAVLTCVLLLILYVIFWLPYFILELMLHNHPTVPEQLITTIYYLRLCPSLFNPLTYTLRKHDLKKAVKKIYNKMFPSCREKFSRKRPEEIPLSQPTYI